MTCLRAVLLSLALALPLTGSVPAARAAEEPTASELAQARKLFRQARTLQTQKKWEEAAGKLRSAIAIKETPGLRYHLAICEEEAGHLVEAVVELDRAAELIELGQKAADVEKLLPTARKRLQQRTPTLTLKIPAELTELQVQLDGRAFKGPPREPIPLNPGVHRVRIEAEGREPFDAAPTLEEGEREELVVKLPQAAAAPKPENPRPPEKREAKPSTQSEEGGSALPWVLLGEGAVVVAGVLVGVGYQLQASSAGDELDEADDAIATAAPGESNPCAAASDPGLVSDCRQRDELADEESTAQTLMLVGYGAAGVGALAMLGTWLLWPEDEPASTTASWRAGGSITPRGGSISLRLRF